MHRLKPEVEKQELELFKQGQFVIEDEEKEDAGGTDRPIPPDLPEVDYEYFLLFICSYLNKIFRRLLQMSLQEMIFHHQFNIRDLQLMFTPG